jgi:hypothetical protein
MTQRRGATSPQPFSREKDSAGIISSISRQKVSRCARGLASANKHSGRGRPPCHSDERSQRQGAVLRGRLPWLPWLLHVRWVADVGCGGWLAWVRWMAAVTETLACNSTCSMVKSL